MPTFAKIRTCLFAIALCTVVLAAGTAFADEEPSPPRLPALQGLGSWLEGILDRVGSELFDRIYDEVGPEHEPIGQPESDAGNIPDEEGLSPEPPSSGEVPRAAA